MDHRVYRQVHQLEKHHWWFRGRRQVLLAALDRLGIDACTILDVGCGAGRP